MRKQQAARLAEVVALPGLMLRATYTDGRVLDISLDDMVARYKAFAPLESIAEFGAAAVADFGWSVEWPCGASIDSDRLMEMALEQSGMAGNVTFRRWQDAHHLSLTDAAAAIGLTRRTVSQYRTGARPVPRYIALACKGWEAEQKGR